MINVGVFDNILTIDISNGDLEHVTSNYDIQITTGTLEVTQRPVTIDTASDTLVYSGDALQNNTFVISSGSLVDGDTVDRAYSIWSSQPTGTWGMGNFLNQVNRDIMSLAEIRTQQTCPREEEHG